MVSVEYQRTAGGIALEGTWRDLKIAWYCKFEETTLAIDASTESAQFKEMEAQVIYESFMKESVAREAAHKSRISTLDIPVSPDCLLGSPERTALTRAKATLVKVVSDMSMMKPSELWKMAVDETVHSVLQSE